MSYPKQSLFKRIKNMMILTVIVLSLIVHLFINSISGSSVVLNSLQICKTALSKCDTHPDIAAIKQDSKDTAHKLVTHINKRFQPESFVLPSNMFHLPAFQESFMDRNKIGHPTAYLLFSVIIARTMRGPPVLA